MSTMAPKRKKKPVGWAKKLIALRKKLGLTQTEAAERIGLSRRAWAGWETNEAKPSAAAVKLLELLQDGKI